MESGPSRVNAPLEGPVIPRSRRDLFKDQSFAYIYNAGTKADMWHAGGVHAKKEMLEPDFQVRDPATAGGFLRHSYKMRCASFNFCKF